MSQSYVYLLALLLTCLIASKVTPSSTPDNLRSVPIEILHKLELLQLSYENTTLKLEAKLEAKLDALQQDIRKLYEERQDGCVNGTSSNDTNTMPTHTYTSCVEAMRSGGESGIYLLHIPAFDMKPFHAYCLKDPLNGPGWTIVQRRQDGSQNFYLKWLDYKNGFGNLSGEFFIGLEKLHALTQAHSQELWIQMEDFEGATRFAKYEEFVIGDESQKYALNKLGKYNGDAGDSLSEWHVGQKFSTWDNNNDASSSNCAKKYIGAWWYKSCHTSNLNGLYLHGKHDVSAQGINWKTWHGYYYSLKYVHMAIRPTAEK